MDTTDTPDTATNPAGGRRPRPPRHRNPLSDAVHDRIWLLTGHRNLRDVDEEERLLMAANLIAYACGWLNRAAVDGALPTDDVAAALELIGTVLTPAPPPQPVE